MLRLWSIHLLTISRLAKAPSAFCRYAERNSVVADLIRSSYSSNVLHLSFQISPEEKIFGSHGLYKLADRNAVEDHPVNFTRRNLGTRLPNILVLVKSL